MERKQGRQAVEVPDFNKFSKVGRPKVLTNGQKVIHVRVTGEQYKYLMKTCEWRKCSVSQLIRDMIDFRRFVLR